MPTTETNLITLLLTRGRAGLAQAIGISEGELAKKLAGENGWRLEQVAKALDYIDVTIVANTTTKPVPIEEYEALKTFARKYLERK